MAVTPLKLLLYFLPLFLIWFVHARRRVRLQDQHGSAKQIAIDQGLDEPVSLHPIIDPNLCIGCRSCLNACPEQANHNTLGLIHGKAELINAADCIGHGACLAVCPVDAITLVFGTEKRGVDIPEVSPSFETNVPGIFISGELGGMGLIRNAIEQGRQAIDSIRRLNGIGADPESLDVLIVGAGPAGFAASLAAMQHGLRFVTVEQDSLGGAITHYPRNKLVMTQAAELPIYGKFQLANGTKEDLIVALENIERDTGLSVNYGERMEDIARNGRGYVVRTNRATYRARAILLAVGRRGTPRKLNVPGEDLSKVVYRLIDAHLYRDQNVLVVGGGDAALEAATSLSMQPGTKVWLSYRSDSFSRARAKNREAVRTAHDSGRLRVILKSTVRRIEPDAVEIEREGQQLRLKNDSVIVCAGGELPTPLLKKLGIRIETKYGTA